MIEQFTTADFSNWLSNEYPHQGGESIQDIIAQGRILQDMSPQMPVEALKWELRRLRNPEHNVLAAEDASRVEKLLELLKLFRTIKRQ